MSVEKTYHVLSLTPNEQVALRGIAFWFVRNKIVANFPRYRDLPTIVELDTMRLMNNLNKLTTQLATEVTRDTKTVFIYHNNSTAGFINEAIAKYEESPSPLASEDERTAIEFCLPLLSKKSKTSLEYEYTDAEIKAEVRSQK